MKRWIRQAATVGLACSQTAAAALYGPEWQSDARWRLLYYGIDLEPFTTAIERDEVRAALGIPADAFVIGHVGRFMEQKNHGFLVEIAAQVLRRKSNAYLLLVGEGVLLPAIQQQVHQLGLAERTLFTGLRRDVPRLMRGAMDLFLLPSLYEGLPMVLLEAQAAGLPCLLSQVISEETDVVMPLLHRCSLEEPAGAWAQTVLDLSEAGRSITQAEALAWMQRSPFTIQNSVHQLEEIYCG
jgi:glycosyltransferase involved in cell wall biosynthesis